jgi:pimeloyl-ACP methyl ester carboxylesterase
MEQVRTRHVFYVEGYDPRGADGYYRLFQRECGRFLKLWPIEVRLGNLVIDSDDIAHWNIEASGTNWQVATRYEFLRLEHFIRRTMAQPLALQLVRAARWGLDDLLSGTLWRVFQASWRFGVFLIYVQAMLVLWIAVAVAGGIVAAVLATDLAGTAAFAAPVIAVAVGLAVFAALRLLLDRWFVLQIATGCSHIREFACGSASGFDRSIDVFAERIVAAARAHEVDELVVIGHSGGAVTAPVVLARALEIDPHLGCHGPRIVLLTLGSILPAFSLYPAAERLRAAIRRLAMEQSLLWVDCQSDKDWLNFSNFDAVETCGIRLGEMRCTLGVWQVRFRSMLSAKTIRWLQWNQLRMHFQFIMGNERRAPYDYFMLVCGPMAVAAWASFAEASKRAKMVRPTPPVQAGVVQ